MVFSKFDKDENDIIEGDEFVAWTNQAQNLSDEERQAMSHKKLTLEETQVQRGLVKKYFEPSSTPKLSLFELGPYSIEWNAFASLDMIN